MYRFENINTGEVINVSFSTGGKILQFQQPVKKWKEFEKILMTENNGKPIIGDMFYDWAGVKKKYPHFAEAIDTLSLNGFNTVYEFEYLNDKKELKIGSVFFHEPTWQWELGKDIKEQS